ncbi:hypothetical protein ACW5F0_09190 [Luteimonas sp. A534]
MVTYLVTMGRPGGGAGVFTALIAALSPGMARNIAATQYPGMSVHAVKVAR